MLPQDLRSEDVAYLVTEVLKTKLYYCQLMECKNILRKCLQVLSASDEVLWSKETYQTSSTQTDTRKGETDEIIYSCVHPEGSMQDEDNPGNVNCRQTVANPFTSNVITKDQFTQCGEALKLNVFTQATIEECDVSVQTISVADLEVLANVDLTNDNTVLMTKDTSGHRLPFTFGTGFQTSSHQLQDDCSQTTLSAIYTLQDNLFTTQMSTDMLPCRSDMEKAPTETDHLYTEDKLFKVEDPDKELEPGCKILNAYSESPDLWKDWAETLPQLVDEEKADCNILNNVRTDPSTPEMLSVESVVNERKSNNILCTEPFIVRELGVMNTSFLSSCPLPSTAMNIFHKIFWNNTHVRENTVAKSRISEIFEHMDIPLVTSTRADNHLDLDERSVIVKAISKADDTLLNTSMVTTGCPGSPEACVLAPHRSKNSTSNEESVNCCNGMTSIVEQEAQNVQDFQSDAQELEDYCDSPRPLSIRQSGSDVSTATGAAQEPSPVRNSVHSKEVSTTKDSSTPKREVSLVESNHTVDELKENINVAEVQKKIKETAVLNAAALESPEKNGVVKETDEEEIHNGNTRKLRCRVFRAPRNRNSYKCEIVDCKEGLFRQRKFVEPGRTPYKCTKCTASFWYENNLVCHSKIHTKEKTTELLRADLKTRKKKDFHECHICRKKYKMRHLLKRHMRTHRTQAFKL